MTARKHMKANQPTSQGNWGRQGLPTTQEAQAHAKEFFKQLNIPDNLKFIGYNDIYDTDRYGKERLLSSGIVFLHKITKKNFRIWVNAFSGKGAICVKTEAEKGMPNYQTIIQNKTAELINRYLSEL